MRSLTFAQFTARLNSMSTEFQTEVKEIVDQNTGDLEVNAKAKAPGGGDPIRTMDGSITASQISEKRLGSVAGNISAAITYKVDPTGFIGTVQVDESAGDLAIYVEMGTGQDASSYLATVPPEWRELAARYIVNRKGRIIHQPYMLNSFMSQKILFLRDLKKALKDLRI